MDGQKPIISPEGVPTGATISPRYMGRVVNTYPLSESEMSIITTLNDQTTVRFTAASFLAGLAFSIWIAACFTDSLNPAGELLVKLVAPLLLFFSGCFAIGGLLAKRRKNSEWDRINKESIPVPAMAASAPLISGYPEKEAP
jgi:hypothetical protein